MISFVVSLIRRTFGSLRYLDPAEIMSKSFTVSRLSTLITGGTSGAKGYVDQVDSSVLHIHQSDSTGYIPFQASETISGASLSATIKGASEVMGTGGPGGMGTSDLKVNSGDIYYLENRAAVVRSSAQTEDIKVVIQI